MTQEQRDFLEAFYRKHFNSLVTYAYRFLYDHNWEDAKEAVQESFVIGSKKIDQFYSSPNHIGWIKKTIRNTAANMNRAKKIRSNNVALSTVGTSQISSCDHYEKTDSAAAHCSDLLSPEEYESLKRTIIDGESTREVAEDMGIPYETFRKRISRILKKLKKNWDS